MRRVRASFLLRCVLLASCVALFACACYLGQGTGWTPGTLVFVVVLWVVGIEGGLLPLALEQMAVKRASKSGRPVSSIWFVDQDEQSRQRMQQLHDDTSNNPTLR